ncbi:hypothetical protein BJQ89_00258 [Arthrobacter sp. ES1]|nr:hypothetical protein [Arthrobacter sp. ES1]
MAGGRVVQIQAGVRIGNIRRVVSHQHYCAVPQAAPELRQHQPAGLRVKVRRGFVQQDDIRPGQERAGNGQPLPFAAAEERTPGPDPCVQSVLQPPDQRSEAHVSQGSAQQLFLSPAPVFGEPEEQVAADGRVEQMRLLRAPRRPPTQQDVAACCRQETQDHGKQGGFSGAGSPGHRQPAAGFGRGRERSEDRQPAGPGGGQVLEFDARPAACPGPDRHQPAGSLCVVVIEDARFADSLKHGPQRRVLPDGRCDSRVGLHQRELEQYNDGGSGGCDGTAEDRGSRQHRAGEGCASASQHGQALPEPLGPGRALGSSSRRAVGAGDGVEHRCAYAVGVELGAGIEGRRHLAEDPGAEALFGAGGHPVRGQGQRRGCHQA